MAFSCRPEGLSDVGVVLVVELLLLGRSPLAIARVKSILALGVEASYSILAVIARPVVIAAVLALAIGETEHKCEIRKRTKRWA